MHNNAHGDTFEKGAETRYGLSGRKNGATPDDPDIHDEEASRGGDDDGEWPCRRRRRG